MDNSSYKEPQRESLREANHNNEAEHSLTHVRVEKAKLNTKDNALSNFYNLGVVSIISWLLGILLYTWFTDPDWKIMDQSQSWPTANGTVIAIDKNGIGRRSPGVHVCVRYRYKIGDADRDGSQQRFLEYPGGDKYSEYGGPDGTPFYVEFQSDQISQKYPVGSKVQVRWNPSQPDQTYINNRISIWFLLDKFLKSTAILLFVVAMLIVFKFYGFKNFMRDMFLKKPIT